MVVYDANLFQEVLELFVEAQSWAPPTFDTIDYASSQIIFRKGTSRGRVKLTPEERETRKMERRAYQRMWQQQHRERALSAPVTNVTRDALKAERLKRERKRMEMRERLADERTGYTHHFCITASREGSDPNAPLETYEVDGYLTTGVFSDGRLGEIFLKLGRHGGEQAVYDAWATGASLLLQRGESVDDLFRRWVGISFEPAGATTNKDVPRCTSVLDYVSRVILLRHGKKL